MFTLNFLPLYERKVKKLIKRNRALAEQIRGTLQRLEADPTQPTLRSHKVPHGNREAFSSRVTGDLRIVWDYSDNEVNVLDVLDIGGHEGSKSVYR